MPTGQAAAVGGDVDAGITNQFGDFPSAVASSSDSAQRTITSSAFANIPTASIAATLALTRATLVMVVISGQFGSAALAAPANTGFLSFALSGALVLAASDINAIKGSSPGIPSAGSFTYLTVAPAGNLTATLQARYNESSGIILRNHSIQLAALRLA
jgi:hypothetical protein